MAWLVTWLVAVVAAGLLLWGAVTAPTVQTIGGGLLGIVAVLTVTLLRMFALRLQNRIIRLEMQVRLTRLGREAALSRLTLGQLIALRFAPDAELPALADRAIAEQLSPDQIKRAVADWQGDFLRT